MINKKIIIFFIILIQLLISIPCDAFEKSDKEISILYAKRYEAFKNSKVFIIDKKTELYKDIENFKVIKTLRYKDEVVILETPVDQCFKKGNSLYQFYKIKTKDNKIGWIKTSSFLFPYIIKNKEVYGVGQKIIYDKRLEAYISDARIIYYNSKKKLEESLYSIEKKYTYGENNKKESYDLLIHLDPLEIELNDINNDKLQEIILKGRETQVSVEVAEYPSYTDVEALYNIKNNKIYRIFLKNNYSSSIMGEIKYSYKYLDLNKDGFIETIDCILTITDFQASELLIEDGSHMHEKTTTLYEYKWDGEKYIYKEYLTPTINNLRFRKLPNLDGKFIRILKKGEKLEILDRGLGDNIQGKMGQWIKVKTEQGEIGWCFDYYLEAWKRNK